MKLKAILSVFVAFSLALSSCDKKNASLVNRRTATPEKIREVEERKRAKEKVEAAEAEAKRLAKEQEDKRVADAKAAKEREEEAEAKRLKDKAKADVDAGHVTPDKSVNGGNAPAVISDSPLIQKLRAMGRPEDEIKAFMQLEKENGYLDKPLGEIIYIGNMLHFVYRVDGKYYDSRDQTYNSCGIWAVRRKLRHMCHLGKYGIPEDAWYRESDEEMRRIGNERKIPVRDMLNAEDVVLLQVRFGINKEHVKVHAFNINCEAPRYVSRAARAADATVAAAAAAARFTATSSTSAPPTPPTPPYAKVRGKPATLPIPVSPPVPPKPLPTNMPPTPALPPTSNMPPTTPSSLKNEPVPTLPPPKRPKPPPKLMPPSMTPSTVRKSVPTPPTPPPTSLSTTAYSGGGRRNTKPPWP